MTPARGQRKEPIRDPVSEVEELREQLREAQETLRAIRSGEVDALVVATPQGDRIYALRGAETPYRVIVENIGEGAATLLRDGMILYANAAFSTILNVPLERILGARFSEFVAAPDRQLLPALFEKGLKTIARSEINITNGASELTVHASLQCLPIDDETQGLSMVITDISEQKRAEEELRKAHDELDVRVQQRTRELKEANTALREEIGERKRTEEKLKKAAEELARSNKELERFAYVASHDLQEPLRTVASYVDLLSLRYRGKLDEKADKYIAYATEGAGRMSSLINDLLAYSRIGMRGNPFERVEMSSVLKRAVGNLRKAIQDSGAEVTADRLAAVTADDTQMVQLFQNLIANAIKFRKENVPPKIHVSCERSSGEWIFSVHDNGIGIQPGFYERIFVIFQRLHTREEYPGTGVGLAICKRIVERHGGRIWAESRQDEGSTFYFSLPATQ